MRWIVFLVAMVLTGPALACNAFTPLPNTKAALPSFRVLAIGSSSTAGVGAGSTARAYPQKLAEALRPWALFPVVEARGVGGETAVGAVARMGRAIAETEPTLVLWQVGTNDANARLDPKAVAETIRKGIAIIRAAGADAMLIDPQYYPRIADQPHYEEMAEMIDRVGLDLCVPVVDRYEDMRDHPDLLLLLAPDRFHMSALGHTLLAQNIGQELRCALGYQCAWD